MVVVAGGGVAVVVVVEGVGVVEFLQDAKSGEVGPLTQLEQLVRRKGSVRGNIYT